MYKNAISIIVNFLDTSFDNKDLLKFVTIKWIEVYDQSGKKYQPNKKIGTKTSFLRSDLCDYSGAYNIVKRTITVVRPNNAKGNKAVTFKNNAPFMNCISKVNSAKIDNAEDLDVVMPMYNLLEYSKNYKKARDSLPNHYRDGTTNLLSSNSESFKYKTSITENTYNNGDSEEEYDQINIRKNKTEVVIPVKHLSNFSRSLNIPLNKCEEEIILTWSKIFILAYPIFC